MNKGEKKIRCTGMSWNGIGTRSGKRWNGTRNREEDERQLSLQDGIEWERKEQRRVELDGKGRRDN